MISSRLRLSLSAGFALTTALEAQTFTTPVKTAAGGETHIQVSLPNGKATSWRLVVNGVERAIQRPSGGPTATIPILDTEILRPGDRVSVRGTTDGVVTVVAEITFVATHEPKPRPL